MKAVLFAAGKSTRTMPLTATRPKPLLRILNKTILAHNLEQLKGIVDEAILVVGYKSEMIEEEFGKSFAGIRLKYVHQETQDGNATALGLCSKWLSKFIVMNADDLFMHEDIKRCARFKYCVLAKQVEDLSRFGEIVIDEGGLKIAEKASMKPGLASTGLMVLDKEIFGYSIDKSERGEYEVVDYIKKLSEAGKKVEVIKADFWIPISYPWSIIDATEVLVKDIKPQVLGLLEKGTTVKDKVRIGKGTVVKAGAYIEGPVLIGEDCQIGPNCYLRPGTVIGDNCKIGNAVEVKNSTIYDGTNISHLSYIGDSVIGYDVNLGAGTKVANLRHDHNYVWSPVKGEMVNSNRKKLGAIIGDRVHTGINTSIYPGRKIWPDKTTLPGEIVSKDIGE